MNLWWKSDEQRAADDNFLVGRVSSSERARVESISLICCPNVNLSKRRKSTSTRQAATYSGETSSARGGGETTW